MKVSLSGAAHISKETGVGRGAWESNQGGVGTLQRAQTRAGAMLPNAQMGQVQSACEAACLR